MHKNGILNSLKKYHFELRHITLIIFVLIIFQIIFSSVQKSSLGNFLQKTQKWYQKESAERIANLSTTSLEILMENIQVVNKTNKGSKTSNESEIKIIESFNIIFSQQLLEQDVQLSCLMVLNNNSPLIIDNGKVFYQYLTGELNQSQVIEEKYHDAVRLFLNNRNVLQDQEQIYSIQTPENTFNVLVPFVPHGEFLGVFYMKNTPNYSFITEDILSGYNEVAVIYSFLILFGLIAMYFISSYSVRERDIAQNLFFEEKEQHLKDQIDHKKEAMFTKRIYHTHHKAEKVMGFIKEDLRNLNKDNIEETKSEVTKYANFVSRVIYDMKWYDPPVQTIRSPIFNTNINEVLKFIIDKLFLRISKSTNSFSFNLELDEMIPNVHINEYVVWEIIEPLIQNSIDHSTKDKAIIKIKSEFNVETNKSKIIIIDNGDGILPELLEENSNGVKKIFFENISTKSESKVSRGYGCYIAYQMATVRCGWKLEVVNLAEGGCKFTIEIQN